MKIAVPVADGILAQHFGHCGTFALFDVDPATAAILGRRDLAPPEHQPGVLPRWLAGQGATHVIAAGLGGRAAEVFARYGVTVTVGAPSEPPDEVVRRFLNGSLVPGANACDH